jgi:hypothetical protein
MNQLLMLQLSCSGCVAQVVLNGLPVLHCQASSSGTATAALAVHEYTLAGHNRWALLISHENAPPSALRSAAPELAKKPLWARARLLLLRHGEVLNEQARALHQLDWAVAPGTRYELPAQVPGEINLPVNFPRWRYLDAPVITLTPPLRRQVLVWAQDVALALSKGDAAPLIKASALRFEELAVAYASTAAHLQQVFHDHVQGLYAAKALKMWLPTDDDLSLQPLCEGRLLELVNARGAPVLRTANAAAALGEAAWPVRLAVVGAQIHVLR